MTTYQYITSEEISTILAERFRERRLFMGWKQSTLAERSGVSLASLRRFEKYGLISLQSLLKLAMVLECLDEFSHLLETPSIKSIEELEKADKSPKRGRI